MSRCYTGEGEFNMYGTYEYREPAWLVEERRREKAARAAQEAAAALLKNVGKQISDALKTWSERADSITKFNINSVHHRQELTSMMGEDPFVGAGNDGKRALAVAETLHRLNSDGILGIVGFSFNGDAAALRRFIMTSARVDILIFPRKQIKIADE